jgi:hypothetical protein
MTRQYTEPQFLHTQGLTIQVAMQWLIRMDEED